MKFFYNCKGSISIFLVLIMLPMFTCAGMIVDGARVSSAKTALSGAGDLAMNAALSEYDDVLKEVYGLFAMSQTSEELEENVAMYFHNTLENAGILQSSDSYTRNYLNSIGSMFSGRDVKFDNVIDLQVESFNLIDIEDSSIASPLVMKRQIMEYMKFRGPVSIGAGLFTKLKLFKGLDKQTKAVEAKLEVDSKMDTLQEACEAAFAAINNYNDRSREDRFKRFQGNLNDSINKAHKNYKDIALSMIKINSSSLVVEQVSTNNELSEEIEEKISQIKKNKKEPPDKYNLEVLQVIVDEMEKLLGDVNDSNTRTGCLDSIEEMTNDDIEDYKYILKSNEYVNKYYKSVTSCMGKFNSNVVKLTEEENIEEYAPYIEYYNGKYEKIEKIIEKANGFKAQWEEDVNTKAKESAMELSQWHIEINNCIGLLDDAISKMQNVKSKVNDLQEAKGNWNSAIDSMDDSDIKTNMKGDYNSSVKDINPAEVESLEKKLIKNKTVLELALARVEENKYYDEKICNDKYDGIDYVKQLQSKIDDMEIDISTSLSKLVNDNIAEHYNKRDASNLETDDGQKAGRLDPIPQDDKFYKFLKKVCPVGEKPDSTGQKAFKDKLTQEASNQPSTGLGCISGFDAIEDPEDIMQAIDALSMSASDAIIDEMEIEGVKESDSDKKSVESGKTSLGNVSGLFSTLGDIGGKMYESMYMTEYITEMFSYYTVDKDTSGKEIEKPLSLSNTPFSAENNIFYRGEVEYILWGKQNMEDNINSTKAMLFGIRFGLNTIYAFTNSTIRNTARTAAVAIAGWSGFGVPIVQGVITIVWSMAESIIDVTELLEGKPVPFFKSKNTWILSAENAVSYIAGEVAEFAKDTSEKFIEDVFEKVNNKAGEGIDGINKNLIRYVEETEQGIVDTITGIVIIPIQEMAMDLISDVYGEVNEETIRQRYDEVMIGIKNDIAGDDDSITSQAKKKAVEILDKEYKEQIIAKIVELNNKLKGSIDSAIEGIFSEFEGVLRRAINSISVGVESILKDSGNKLKEEINNLTQKGEDFAKEKVNDLIDNYAGKMAGAFGGAGGDSIQTSASSGITFTYEEYLKVIILMNCMNESKETTMLNRMAKLIQLNLSEGGLSKEKGKFNITKKYTMVEINSTASIRTTFLNVPIPTGKVDSDGRTVYELDYSRIGSNRRGIDYVGINGY